MMDFAKDVVEQQSDSDGADDEETVCGAKKLTTLVIYASLKIGI